MNLIACSGCGIVYDADVLPFPKDVWRDDGYGGKKIDYTKATEVWDDDYRAYFPKVDCRVCGTFIQSKKMMH